MQLFEQVVRIGTILDGLGIPWVLGGSMASSLVGEPRSTLDVDVAVLLERDQISRLIDTLGPDYYVDEAMAAEAVSSHSSFNLVHYPSGTKIDVFVLSDDPLDQRQLRRRERIELDGGRRIWVGAADDQVLRKLRWYQAGGETSDRQWRDILAILTVQRGRIDVVELLDVAEPLGLRALAERAVDQVERDRSDGAGR